ncbi:hypothetical protein ABBQ38_014682 [Trebouxia sp. C0009 RCD-2024]
MPCPPTPEAFQELLTLYMRNAEWHVAADLALQGASLHPDAAQDGLRAILAGAREAVKPGLTAASDTLAADVSSSSLDLRGMLVAFAKGCANQDVSLPETDAAMLALFQAIDFGQQDEAEAAHQILRGCNPATSPKLQNAFLSGVCSSADVGLALDCLQRYSQQEEHAQLYRTVLTRLACSQDVAAVLNKAISASASGERVVSGLMGALPEGESVVAPELAATVWAMFQQACKHGHALSAQAQHALWLSQPDDQVTQLYRHFQSTALPLLTLPPAAKLADVAKLSSKHSDWETALAAAQDVAATDTHAAVRLVNKIMGVMQIYGGNIGLAAAAMPLFGLLEAQCTERVQPDHLHMACLAYAHLGNTTAALEGVTRHEPLTAAWTAEQQQLVFHSMLSVLKQKGSDDSAIQVTQHVWMVAVRSELPDRQLQLSELVKALLSPGRLPMAHQLLKQAAELGLLQADLVEPALAKSLQQDARGRSSQMSNRSCSLLTMMKQTAGLHWPQRLHEATASLLTEALLQHPHQPEIAHMFEDRTAASLAVPQALWDAAISVYHKTSRDDASMWRAWQWMQLKGLSWAPSDPASYVSIAHAVTAQGDPQQGANMLKSYHKKAYVPAPAVSTFTQATLCVLAQLRAGVPAHQVLIQLQQEVWADMQTGDDSTAYLAALNIFEGTEAVQTAILMSQNGLSGLCGDACIALVCAMEEHHDAWLRETCGDAFVAELEVLANSTGPGPAWLPFPAHPLPKLSVVQLDGKPSHLGVADGDTPWWMVPATAWQHGHIVNHAAVNQQASPSDPGPERSAAEQLAAEYGHLEKAGGSKRRK